MINVSKKESVFLFLDEGGNLHFDQNGSRYFTLTSVMTKRPFVFQEPLCALRYDLLEQGIAIERFHAAEDTQATRNAVFAVLQACLPHLRADSVIVEKCKTGPSLQDESRFYPEMVGHLLQYVINGASLGSVSQFVVVTDKLPLTKKRKAIEKGLHTHLPRRLPKSIPFRIFHQESKSSCGLQVADYFNWAIYRKWTNGDHRSFNVVRGAVRSEFDIFRRGQLAWY